MKQSVIIAFLGKTQDRFCEYHAAKTTREKLQMVQRIKGFDGVEMVYPHETTTAAEIKAMMQEFGLNWAAINANVKKDPQVHFRQPVAPKQGNTRRSRGHSSSRPRISPRPSARRTSPAARCPTATTCCSRSTTRRPGAT